MFRLPDCVWEPTTAISNSVLKTSNNCKLLESSRILPISADWWTLVLGVCMFCGKTWDWTKPSCPGHPKSEGAQSTRRPSKEPSNASLFTFYVYRAASEEERSVLERSVFSGDGERWWRKHERWWVFSRSWGVVWPQVRLTMVDVLPKSCWSFKSGESSPRQIHDE